MTLACAMEGRGGRCHATLRVLACGLPMMPHQGTAPATAPAGLGKQGGSNYGIPFLHS